MQNPVMHGNSFLDFQKQLFAAQQDENKEWLTKELLDKDIKNNPDQNSKS